MTNRPAVDPRAFAPVIRRLPAEALLDAVSQVTGAPTIFPNFAVGTRAMQVPDARVSNYFLTVFGKPLRMVTVESERTAEPSVAQALHTINGDTINEKLRAPGGVVDSFIKLGLSDEMVIQHLYLAAFSRAPRAEEAARLLAAMREAMIKLGGNTVYGVGFANIVCLPMSFKPGSPSMKVLTDCALNILG